LMLGDELHPLPALALLDRPLWMGVAVNGRSMSMLSPLSSSIYALNVPDNSITQKKLATDYVSSISINGQQITNKGSGLNIVGGDGVSLTFDPGTQSLLIGASGLTESARD